MTPHEKWSLVLQAGTFVFAAIVAGIYAGQWCTMERALSQGSRARVAATAIAMDPKEIVDARPIAIDVTIVNDGPTAATNVSSQLARTVAANCPADPVYDSPLGAGSRGTLPRGVPHHMAGEIHLRDGEVADILATPPRRRLFIHGRVAYNDGFEESNRLTTFCWMYAVVAGRPMAQACQCYNHSD